MRGPGTTPQLGIVVILKKLLVLFWAFLLAAAAIAGEEQRTRIEIAIDNEESGQRSFKFDSADAGFNMHDMAVGETRELTGESGNTAQLPRTEDGFVLDDDGEKIDLSDLHDADEARIVHVDRDHRKKRKKVRMIKSDDDNSVTVISDKAIDEETRERIREVLESAGQDGEVVFIDRNELRADGGAHERTEVRVIRKEVDVTN